MKKLAFIINVFRENDFHSGGEKLFYELVSRSTQQGHKVDLYCTTYLGNEDILRKKLNKLIFLGHPKDFKHPEKIETFYNKVKSLIEKENYDFTISENIAPLIDIGVLQGHSFLHCRDKAGNFLSRLIYNLTKNKHIKAQKRWLKPCYRKIIVPSEILKNELAKNFKIPEEKFLVIHPGVDHPQVVSTEKKPAAPFVFGISAPSFGKKGGYLFLKALSLLKNRGYDFQAKLIHPKFHKSPLLKLLVKYYRLENKVEFLPYQKDMQEFYSSIDCLVMPSVMETFGLVALEAMIWKKPAIIGSFCGACEIINEGENGFVFNMSEKPHKNLAEKMEIFLNNSADYKRISENAYKTALTYSWENFYKVFKENFLLRTYPENNL